MHSLEGNASLDGEKNLHADDLDSGLASATFPATAMGTSSANLASAEVSRNGADEYDMFADDDEHTTTKPSTDESNSVSQPSTDAVNSGIVCMIFRLHQEIWHLKQKLLLLFFIELVFNLT